VAEDSLELRRHLKGARKHAVDGNSITVYTVFSNTEKQDMPAARKTAPSTPAPRKRAAKTTTASTRATKASQALRALVKTAAAAKTVKTAKVPKAEKGDKAADKNRKPKLVRDSFTMPKDEYVMLDALKQRAAKLGRPVKKSELLRAGVMALGDMGDAAFLASVTGVPPLKTGRPAKAAD
jgi:hypothetical protein